MLRVAKTLVTNKEETSMRFYTKQHPFYCGIDLHARTMDVCLLDQAGKTRLHRNMPATPEALLKASAPSREQIVLAAACMFTWYWLADLWAEHGTPLVLGHALYLKAIHGGKAKNAKGDAHKIAVRLRGGMLPQAYGYPAEMRATRALLRRRMHRARTRGELLAQVHKTHSQDNLPAIGTKIAYKTPRDGVAERFADPAVQKRIAVARALIPYDDERRRDVELAIVNTATHHDATTLDLLHTVPGMGQILSLVLLYDIPPSDRCPRGQDCASYCRLVKGAKEAAGKRSGTSGTNIGNAPLQGAFSEAAGLVRRTKPAGQTFLPRWEKKHSNGKALTS
jgi:transposase